MKVRPLLKTLLAAALGVMLVRLIAFTSCTIPSEGMENTLYRGDRVIVSKWSYGFRIPLASLFGLHRWGDAPVRRGDIVLFNNPSPRSSGKVIDFRETFISRCTGLPGDTLLLDEERLPVCSKAVSPHGKLLYTYPDTMENRIVAAIRVCRLPDNELVGYRDGSYLRCFSRYEAYLIRQEIGAEVPFRPLQDEAGRELHPYVVPGKGISVRVYPWNAALLCHAINRHEGHKAALRGDTLQVDGHPVASYTFTQDYHWMTSDNPLSPCDSRRFGFVPKSHLIGRAVWIWFSKDTEGTWWQGFRPQRFFRRVQ